MDSSNYQPDDQLEPIMDQLEELRQLLSNKGGNDLVGRVILQIVEDSGMTLESLERMWTRSLLFSDTKWETVAPSLGLRGDLGISQLELFTIPPATPPPSFHRELAKNALRWMDVYREPWNQNQGEAQAHWYILVFSLFNGRLVDLLEKPMPLAPETSSGEVKHKVFLSGNLVLFIIRRKFGPWYPGEFYAQALLELVSAVKLDRDQDFDPQPPVYAVLADLDSFIFLSYDGTNFRHMAQVQIPPEGRVGFMYGMAQDVLFSLLLHGYIEILAAVEKLSTVRSEADDSSEHNRFSIYYPCIEKPGGRSPMPSLDSWSKALLKAREAQTILTKPDFTTEETWEQDSLRGMAMLNERFE
ncbi:hypothetical protein BS47DRAFT_1393420 [Hydnum rufescens UP504]|uniref:Uncharacterized protein n=1 Tax=Hydnum rufescens UP504 TaxID=1448309 RepID=A0A9P6DX01_9AGAM|nr:hypothetical protein BS47DRAFT_1393420 [Hydnum rufescens UP504]